MTPDAQQEFSVTVKETLLHHPKFTTVSDVARKLGVHRNTVSRAINRPCMNKQRKRIAQLLGITLPTQRGSR